MPSDPLPGSCRAVLRPGDVPTLSIFIGERALISDRKLALPVGIPLKEEMTIFPEFANSGDSATFAKLTNPVVLEARLFLMEQTVPAKQYELHFTTADSGLRHQWLIQGPNALASRIVTPNRDFIAAHIIPTLKKPLADDVIAAFGACTESSCLLQHFGPYGQGPTAIFYKTARFFSMTLDQERQGWWHFERSGPSGPWTVSRPAPNPYEPSPRK